MSTVCVIGHPAAGHINPTLPVVGELVRRGERAVYFATEPFRSRIEATGASFRTYGEHGLFERNLSQGGMLGGMAGLMQTTEEILPALIAQVQEEEPDYLLVEAHAVWGNLLAQFLDLPAATLCSMFAMNEKLLQPRELIGHLYGSASCEAALGGLIGLSIYAETARRVARRYGTRCPGIVDYLANPQPLNIVFTSREFQIGSNAFDDRYCFVGPSIPESHGEPLPGLDSHRTLIYVSMGTMYNDELGLYRECFRAFAGQDVQVVMAVGHRVDRSKLADVPPNFVIREYVPQMAVLANADLFITHGGINSAHEAMLNGVPMIVLPRSADHFVVAGQVAAAGAGIVLHRPEATAGRLIELQNAVMANPAYRHASAAMGRSLRAAGGYTRAADEILKYTHAHA